MSFFDKFPPERRPAPDVELSAVHALTTAGCTHLWIVVPSVTDRLSTEVIDGRREIFATDERGRRIVGGADAVVAALRGDPDFAAFFPR